MDSELDEFLETAKRLKKFEFRISNNEGGIIEFKAKSFNNDICAYSILATGKMTGQLLKDYLINYDNSLRPLRSLGYKIVGLAEVYKLTLPEGFTEADLIALSNGLASIVQGDVLISTGSLNFKDSKLNKPKPPIPNSDVSLFKNLYNRYLRYIGPRSIHQGDDKNAASTITDVEEAIRFAQEIVGASLISDINSAVIALGYQIIFKLPKDIIMKFPKKQGELEDLFISMLQDINPDNFESKKSILS
jgi:hypothetical protein